MNVLAIYVVNEYLQSMPKPSYPAFEPVAGPSLRDRIASAAAGLRRFASSSAAATGALPKLGDNPYRS